MFAFHMSGNCPQRRTNIRKVTETLFSLQMGTTHSPESHLPREAELSRHFLKHLFGCILPQNNCKSKLVPDVNYAFFTRTLTAF